MPSLQRHKERITRIAPKMTVPHALQFNGRGFNLRPFRRGDEISLAKNIRSPGTTRYTLCIPSPYTLAHARQWVKRNLALDRTGKQLERNFVIDIDGQVAGSVGLNTICGHRAELGYWLAAKYRDRGIMTAAVKLLTVYSIKKLALRRLYAYVLPGNKSSARVLQKAGYRYEGRLRGHALKNGKLQDLLVFGKVTSWRQPAGTQL